ncbi:hypothetical protein TIFTF001_015497 [Ficus carica]|uniref:Uncharacterized protein n=1 Tax=Ficus carica TaxID=3494 RepID=A0AA87ZYU1_FICCA|nr:hypothetical protein TIFTF001_015497 [Ficus carica]
MGSSVRLLRQFGVTAVVATNAQFQHISFYDNDEVVGCVAAATGCK